MTGLTLKRHDRGKSIVATLYENATTAATRTPINLASCAVAFHARNRQSGTVVINAAATITDAANGAVRYDLQAADVANVEDCDIEWEITLPSGYTVTVPNTGHDRLTIIEDLA